MKISPENFKTAIITAVILTVWLRIVMFMTGYILTQRIDPIPITTGEMDFSQNIPRFSNDPWYFVASPLHRFDALWYEEVAKYNYQGSVRLTAFYPLYPWLVNLGAIIFHISYPSSAFVMNTFLTGMVFFLLFCLTLLEYDRQTALRTVFVYSVFPTVFFLLSGYAEPLLFVFVLTSLIMARQGKSLLSVLFGGLAAMTKPYGAAILIPLTMIILRSGNFREKFKRILLLGLIPLSTLLVTTFQNLNGSALTNPIKAQSSWAVTFPLPWQPIVQQVSMFIRNPFDLSNNLYLFVFAGGLYLLIYSFRKIRAEYWTMSLVFFVIFYFFAFRTGIPSSLSRHGLILFPLFMYLARLKVPKIAEFVYCASSVFLLILSSIYFIFGFFIS